MPFSEAALLLLGHGSTLNSDSSAPTYQHAEELRRRRLFAEVHVGFWKEEPNFRQSLRQTACRRIYVVPNFISSGYFTEQVIPRELGLNGAVTRHGPQEIIYCEPVGLHSRMREALLQRAREIVADSSETILQPEKTACLFICGHGTSFNDNSTKIIYEQAGAIRALGIYADCQPVLMEQKPFVKDWRTLTSCPDAIVVPFFIADGLHSFEDIPVLLGLTDNIRERAFQNPHRETGRRLWYARAIGTEKFLADVILAQVEKAATEHPAAPLGGDRMVSPVEEALGRFSPGTEWKIGQIAVNGSLELRHEEDMGVAPSALQTLSSLEEVREWARLDGEGRFRALHAAPTLRRGWIYRASDLAGLREVLDYFYPAELAHWTLWQDEQLPITPWRETAERQSGRFRVVREIDAKGVAELVAKYCEPGCLKLRQWSPAQEAVRPASQEIPLLCPEACNFLVGKAREMLKGPGEE